MNELTESSFSVATNCRSPQKPFRWPPRRLAWLVYWHEIKLGHGHQLLVLISFLPFFCFIYCCGYWFFFCFVTGFFELPFGERKKVSRFLLIAGRHGNYLDHCHVDHVDTRLVGTSGKPQYHLCACFYLKYIVATIGISFAP